MKHSSGKSELTDIMDSDDEFCKDGMPVVGRPAEPGARNSMVSDTDSYRSDDLSALNVSHTMKMGLYSINLGTRFGQRVHAAHMLILPLIPVFILLAQNGGIYTTLVNEAKEIQSVQNQVSNAMDLSNLIQKVQEERSAVALNIFLKRSATDDLKSLQQYVENGVNITKFSLLQTFNATDTVLQSVTTWPNIDKVDFFDTKLKFQIQHSIFRTKIREGDKSIFDVLNWYNEIINFFLGYISLSIHDSDVSDFYRYIIAFKDLLRSVEYSGKSGIYALRYFSQGQIEREHHHDFIRFEMLRKEYLNQTFNFMPELRVGYAKAAKNQYYEQAQNLVTYLDDYQESNDTIEAAVRYFSQLEEYIRSSKELVDGLTKDIESFVAEELARFQGHKTLPMILFVSLTFFIPLVAYIDLQATRFSKLHDERMETYQREKKKTEKLLLDLLPKGVLEQMKRGKTPDAEYFDSVSIFLGDIVGFTALASESTAHQTVEVLNNLYNLFDSRLENYSVYKVETIGDAYLVASGVTEAISNHAAEISKMALDLLAKVVTFEVGHRPGYRIQLRMGIHSGMVVAGVVGRKIPHYSVFGETVEIAGLMESTGEPMKIQISGPTKNLLARDGTFSFVQRGEAEGEVIPEKLGDMPTFWLVGRNSGATAGSAVSMQENELAPPSNVKAPSIVTSHATSDANTSLNANTGASTVSVAPSSMGVQSMEE